MKCLFVQDKNDVNIKNLPAVFFAGSCVQCRLLAWLCLVLALRVDDCSVGDKSVGVCTVVSVCGCLVIVCTMVLGSVGVWLCAVVWLACGCLRCGWVCGYCSYYGTGLWVFVWLLFILLVFAVCMGVWLLFGLLDWLVGDWLLFVVWNWSVGVCNVYCAQKETHIFMSLILCNIWSFEIYKIKTVRK